ncbi:hypothetical protein GCM10023350_33410 [Nocardioides endophyticus]|uniref:DUF222 domain-containing protein n=1 Tax=Nocardioides endophyticus TaxID=1353775 RepID=A0ABP8Z468_9ACTN
MPNDPSLSSLITESEDALLARLGDQLIGGDGTLRDGGFDDARARASDWFERNRDKLRSDLCGNSRLSAITDKAEEAGAIADLISELLSGPAGFTAGAILAKYALARICRDVTPDDPADSGSTGGDSPDSPPSP